MGNVFQSCVKCKGSYILDVNAGCFNRVPFNEGYILDLNSPLAFLDKDGSTIVGYTIALPNGEVKFAAIGEIKIDMFTPKKLAE